MATSPDQIRSILDEAVQRGATADQVRQIHARLVGSGEQQAGQPQAQPEGEKIGKFDRFMFGITDPSNAIGQGILHALPESITGMTPQDIDNQFKMREMFYQKDRAASGDDGIDWMRALGSGVATAPVAALLPSGGATMAAKIGQGALQGAAASSLQPVTGDDSFLKEKASQAGLGAALGGVASPVLSSIGGAISPVVSQARQAVEQAGITPTIGQSLGGIARNMEEKLTSVPVLGNAIQAARQRTFNELNQAAYDRALAPIGQKFEGQLGREGIASVKSALQDEYNKILPTARFNADQQFVQDFDKISSMAADMPKPQADQFNKIIQNKLFARLGQQGQMDGLTFKGVEEEFKTLAQGYLKDQSFDNRQLGSALGEVLSSLRQNLVRSNPDHAKALNNINTGWANYSVIRKAASSLGAEEGVFTPAQLQNAVKANDRSKDKTAFAMGKALMQDLSEPALKVLGNKVPDSGTAGRLAAMGAVVGSGAVNPMIPASVVGSSLLYTPTGQKLAAALLSKRPQMAQDVRELLTSQSGRLAAALSLPVAQRGEQ